MLALSCVAAPAVAQSQRDQSASEAPAAVQPTPSPVLPVQSANATPGPYQTYDALAMRGWERPLPKSGDTLLGDKLGVRDALADAGIGFIGFASNAIQYNFLQNDGGYKGRQLYNAQKLTRNVSNAAIFATYDLGRIGITNGQFIFSALYTSNSFNRVDGPNATRIGRLAYYQSLFNKKVEFKIGYFDNGFEFLGTQTGGSLAGGTLGPQASVPNEVGLSYSGFSTPTANIRINFKNHVYTKLGIQRSLPPGGATPEVAANSSGLRFHIPGTGLLTIGEVGWDQPAKPGTLATWVRAGGIYNSTNFNRFQGGQSKDNWATYIAVDHQLFQIDDSKANRGLYVGGTVNYAPPQQNFISQYYEGRIYGVGLVKSRPFDLASIVANANIYSKQGLVARTAAGQGNFKQTYSVIASYAYRLTPGLYFQPGIGAVVHPIYSPRFDTAVNGYLTLTFFI
ncbi:carbohydrate porin [Sphingomonas abietis]|uniref:Carbohydrate porin n=1 Tax=Sphingomonas abietis TaxID=3012344 RepID=A0ABY7NIE1_9SPHN|nr:carbohydrate porin [Sphingomonas abietis]WBO21297.1 carbohydrate porin [Sphingomonas abietis]